MYALLIVDFAECCMSGCAICVYDLHDDSLSAYKKSLAAFRENLVAMGVPEEEWPINVREKSTKEKKAVARVSLSAFEEMERSLKAKKEAEFATS